MSCGVPGVFCVPTGRPDYRVYGDHLHAQCLGTDPVDFVEFLTFVYEKFTIYRSHCKLIIKGEVNGCKKEQDLDCFRACLEQQLPGVFSQCDLLPEVESQGCTYQIYIKYKDCKLSVYYKAQCKDDLPERFLNATRRCDYHRVEKSDDGDTYKGPYKCTRTAYCCDENVGCVTCKN